MKDKGRDVNDKKTRKKT